jgi:hypothetical protein
MPSREASLRNLEKAKRNWRAPRPLRCRIESLVIRRLVWQWHHDRSPRKWPARAVARALGVSHTYVQKLVREFVENPNRILTELRASPGVATVDTFERAQRETHRDREGLRPQPKSVERQASTSSAQPFSSACLQKPAFARPMASIAATCQGGRVVGHAIRPRLRATRL